MAQRSEASLLMTEGSIARKLVRFALPVFWGNLFQQLYNVVDSLVVGNLLGSEALAAVGSSGSLIFLLVGLFYGTFSGAGVVVSRFFGARDNENVSKAVHTTVTFGLLCGVAVTILGSLLAPQILVWMGTPENVLPNSLAYVRVYFGGVLTVVMYNTVSGIMQAVGDSRHPLYYLLTSSIVNVVLDILFVGPLHMGIAGAAWATVIAQATSAMLGLYRLTKVQASYRLELRKLRIHPRLLKQILYLGIPSGIQNSIVALANLVVQSNINAFGSMAMAGCGAYAKIEGFGFLPITSFSLALTTFIGQNLGAKEYDRAKRGARMGILACMVLAELIGACIYLFSPLLISAFDHTPEVVAVGVKQARTITLFYFLLALTHGIAAVMRGAGRSIVPMLVMLVCWCVIRIAYIVLIVRVVPDIQAIFWAYPLTWSLSSVALTAYYFRGDWTHSFEKQCAKA